jgi:hypothetical protein
MSQSSSEPSANSEPAATTIGKLQARIQELETALELEVMDRTKSEEELEEHVLSHARAEQARGSARLLRDVVDGDRVIHLRPSGRPYPPLKRQAALEKRLTRWSETYRYEVLAVGIIGS